MKVNLNFDKNICLVSKEKGDPIFRHTTWASAESTFLYYVKQELIKQGYNVIKKLMWKDGHLVDDTQQYIRTRHWGDLNVDGEFCVYNSEYSIVDAGETFNKHGSYRLRIE